MTTTELSTEPLVHLGYDEAVDVPGAESHAIRIPKLSPHVVIESTDGKVHLLTSEQLDQVKSEAWKEGWHTGVADVGRKSGSKDPYARAK